MAICLGSIFMIFIVELIAFRWGTAVLAKVGVKHDPHGHGLANGAHAAHGPEPRVRDGRDSDNAIEYDDNEKISADLEKSEARVHEHEHGPMSDSAIAQIIGVAILEFGVLLHRWASRYSVQYALC